MGPNPNVVGCLTAKGPCYRGEIHAQRCFDKDKKPHYTEEQMMLFDFARAHTTDEALETIGDISLTAEVRRQRWRIKRVVAIQDRMKRDEDALFMELLEKRECTYCLEEANAAARIVQALAEDKHVKKLTPWMQYMQEADTEDED